MLNIGYQELVATSSLVSVNPDRLAFKRTVLNEHPLKIRKSAIVRFVLFNPGLFFLTFIINEIGIDVIQTKDVIWFKLKSIELRTR